MAWDAIVALFRAGIDTLTDYFSAHVLFCLVPALFIAGALSTLIPKGAITKYLGRDASKIVSYPLAAVGGFVLAVCSCTILPLFAGILTAGAGLGPAITFLFVGPAINVLAITYTGGLLGFDFAIARLVLAIVFGLVLGLVMNALFGKAHETERKASAKAKKFLPKHKHAKSKERFGIAPVLLVALMFLFLLIATFSPQNPSGLLELFVRFKMVSLFVVFLSIIILAVRGLSRDKIRAWLRETAHFTKSILPFLVVGVFLAGVFKALIPQGLIGNYAGGNSVLANLAAVLFGVFMYFPTLLEVPIARAFLDLGMGRGPLLAYLLADPELSIQSILVTSRFLGRKKTFVYVLMVTVACTVAGLIFGMFYV